MLTKVKSRLVGMNLFLQGVVICIPHAVWRIKRGSYNRFYLHFIQKQGSEQPKYGFP